MNPKRQWIIRKLFVLEMFVLMLLLVLSLLGWGSSFLGPKPVQGEARLDVRINAQCFTTCCQDAQVTLNVGHDVLETVPEEMSLAVPIQPNEAMPIHAKGICSDGSELHYRWEAPAMPRIQGERYNFRASCPPCGAGS